MGSQVVVSLRSRGLASVTRQSWDFRHQAITFGIEVFDIAISYLLTLYSLSWTSWLSLVISIMCLAISMSDGAWLKQRQADYQATVAAANPTAVISTFYIENGIITGSVSNSFWMPFLGALFLPLAVLTAMVLWRREQALSHMAGFKANAVGLCLGAAGGMGTAGTAMASGADVIRKQVFLLLDDLHRYLHHKRPYARHFYLPYSATSDASSPGNEMLFLVSREMGILLRKVQLSVRDVHGAVQLLRDAGASEAHVDSLLQLAIRLHTSVEQLCAIKEMRTPVMLRATVRWMSVVIFPVFMGFFAFALHCIVPYLSDSVGLFVIHIQIALCVLTDIVVATEDPFDDTSLDTLSLFEVLDHISAMTTPDDLSDPAGLASVSAAAAADGKGPDGAVLGGKAYQVDPFSQQRAAAARGTSPGQQQQQLRDSAASVLGGGGAAGSGGAFDPQQQQQQQQQQVQQQQRAPVGSEAGLSAAFAAPAAASGAGQPVAVRGAAGGPQPEGSGASGRGTSPAQGQGQGGPGQGPVVYTVTLPPASQVSGRRQNPSLPMPPMPSNLT